MAAQRNNICLNLNVQGVWKKTGNVIVNSWAEPLFSRSYALTESLCLLHLEQQVHEDEEFAQTLAMLDEEPQAKKVIKLFISLFKSPQMLIHFYC